MPLYQPPDYSKVVLVFACTLGVTLTILVATRNTLPHVGDHSHSLPHGGCYKDGTKSIFYNSPNQHTHGNTNKQIGFIIPLAIAIILLVLTVTYKPRTRSCVCYICRTHS
uniref:TGB2 n=1 Tax=Dioscorea potexvirus 1 TaxID=2794413 RepID=A0A7T5QZ52_9VIRU|nr:TGB2 [Dioscorea potexvirus 1]